MSASVIDAQGLVINRTIQALHLDKTEVGPFIPDDIYRLDRLDFLALKNNSIVGAGRSPAKRLRMAGDADY